MHVITGPRRSGKTTLLINRLHQQPNAVLITFSEERALQLKREFPDVSERIQAWDRFDPRSWPAEPTKILIDDLEMVLGWLLHGRHVEIAALTGSSEALTVSQPPLFPEFLPKSHASPDYTTETADES